MKLRILMLLALVCLTALPVMAAVPEISHVNPDFAGMHQRYSEYQTHRVITGEGFEPAKLEFWCWAPKGDIEAAIKSQDFGKLQLPATPPKDAVKVKPLDVEQQVAVAALSDGSWAKYTVIWASNGDGYSRPYALNTAKPFWISRNEAHPSDILYMFGFGLRSTPGGIWLDSYCHVALRSPIGTIIAKPVREGRAARSSDPNLVYFELPDDTPLGNYAVYVHNGQGGPYGWRKAGDLKVTAPPAPKTGFNAREFGATGQGVTCDLPGLRAAIEAAAKVGGGRVLLPPGTYRISETLQIPEGVELIGSGSDQTVIEGFRYDTNNPLKGWWAPTTVAASVLVLESSTRLEGLSVRGAVSKGSGGYGMISTASSPGGPHDITIKGCTLKSPEADNEDNHFRYRAALSLSGRNHSLLDSDITGSLETRPGVKRCDIINNTFRGGYALDECSTIFTGTQLLVDANRLTDATGRLCFYITSRSYIRYNEVLNYGSRSNWENVSEPILLHGGSAKTMGSPTAAGTDTLTDARQAWQKDQYSGATVLITCGKGRGQYRMVTGNSKDTLTLEAPWRVQPDATSEYAVGGFFTENALFANQNHTPGQTPLWLDCIGNIVEKQRDIDSGGITTWGQDRSSVDAKGQGKQLERFHPSWYNLFMDNWLDGSSLNIVPGVSANNAWRGIPVFGNMMIHNKVRQPHMQRNAFSNFSEAYSTTVGGLIVGGGQGRVGASHTIISGNQVSNTTAGVVISGQADKTFIIGNFFHAVDQPIIDEGGRTTLLRNHNEKVTEKGREKTPIPDGTGERVFPQVTPPSLAEPFVVRSGSRQTELGWLNARMAGRPYDVAAAGSAAVEQACAENLKKVYILLQAYDKAHGKLPDALFYSVTGQDEGRSLAALLGPEAVSLLSCPGAGHLESLQYLWNNELNGKSFKSFTVPGGTWMLMDMAAAHASFVGQGIAGHRGGVNVLFVDGQVRSIRPEEATRLLTA